MVVNEDVFREVFAENEDNLEVLVNAVTRELRVNLVDRREMGLLEVLCSTFYQLGRWDAIKPYPEDKGDYITDHEANHALIGVMRLLAEQRLRENGGDNGQG